MAFDASILRPTQFGDRTALTDAATIATDASVGFRYTVTIAVARTLGAPTNGKDGDLRIWEVTNSSGGALNLTLTTTGTGFAATAEVVTPIAIAAGKTATLFAYYSAPLGKWVCLTKSVTT